MYMQKPRGLNPGESYACSRTAVRKCFEQMDLAVLWGNQRSFEFDTRMRKRPSIEGKVVASLSVNRNRAEHAILNFYIIDDEAYGEKPKKLFEEGCLPRMKAWLLAEPRLRGGIDELLIAWTGSSFRIHEIHFA